MRSIAKSLAPREGRVVGVAGAAYRLLMSGEETGGQYALVEGAIPPGAGTPVHIHRREDETFYIIEGELTILVGDKPVRAPAGSMVSAVRDVPHALRNETAEPVRLLTLIVPAGFEQFFLAVGDALGSLQESPAAPSPEHLRKLISLAPQYGLEILA